MYLSAVCVCGREGEGGKEIGSLGVAPRRLPRESLVEMCMCVLEVSSGD